MLLAPVRSRCCPATVMPHTGDEPGRLPSPNDQPSEEGRLVTDWIRKQPDTWMAEFARLTGELGGMSFLSHPERGCDGQLFNSMFVISRNGEIIGRQRKLYTGQRGLVESGESGSPVSVDGINVGLLICADAYSELPARRLRAAGAELLVSTAA